MGFFYLTKESEKSRDSIHFLLEVTTVEFNETLLNDNVKW